MKLLLEMGGVDWTWGSQCQYGQPSVRRIRALVNRDSIAKILVGFRMHPKLYEFMDPDREDFELVSQVRNATMQPMNIDFTSTGVYGTNDPRNADPEEFNIRFEERVSFFVDFIKIWKTIPVPNAFKK